MLAILQERFGNRIKVGKRLKAGKRLTVSKLIDVGYRAKAETLTPLAYRYTINRHSAVRTAFSHNSPLRVCSL